MTKIPESDAQLLSLLSDAFGPPGFEDEIRQVIAGMVEPLADSIEIDALGNLLVRMVPAAEGLPLAMLDCHMDDVGFMVSNIDERGFLSFVGLGGWDERILPSHCLTIVTREGHRVLGSLGTSPPHILKGGAEPGIIRLDQLRCDVGAASAEEVAEMGVRVGDPAAIHYPARPLGPQGQSGEPAALIGKGFDNRAGCAALIRLLQRFQAAPPTGVAVAASFSVAEEVGLRGARTAAWQLDPDFALALEGTIAADVPGVEPALCPTRQRQGAAITVADRSLLVPRRFVALAESVADERGIPWQHKLPISGGTDAGSIHLTRGGVPSMVLSAPCRYIHSPVTTMRLSDFQALVGLAEAVVREVEDLLH